MISYVLMVISNLFLLSVLIITLLAIKKLKKENDEYELIISNKNKNDNNEEISQLQKNIDKYKKELQILSTSLNAGRKYIEEHQKEGSTNDFYSLSVTAKEQSDIDKLNAIKLQLHQPVIVSKIIWSTFFQKQTTELCNKIFGNKTCGIYKITNKNNLKCYIGQSVNLSDRLKNHIKAGLGINTSQTNKLYAAMQEEGICNFTFELLEECNKDELNQKEKLWIETFDSNINGYNSNSGNKN